eukprot:CAMPEP_0119330506 /NCGR_PEP_ID=MMETSP1333-20130426/78386_1 /TAXON_ID=418940 /ORGANISM="Scyphosphaera apsteinii, Strain RCC1455" /LENGTH=565 /DNA_ID=CAMNT_0007339901 /DNA_START=303 /DNA_END=2000 /DNA_ORIENTATION=-
MPLTPAFPAPALASIGAYHLNRTNHSGHVQGRLSALGPLSVGKGKVEGGDVSSLYPGGTLGHWPRHHASPQKSSSVVHSEPVAGGRTDQNRKKANGRASLGTNSSASWNVTRRNASSTAAIFEDPNSYIHHLSDKVYIHHRSCRIVSDMSRHVSMLRGPLIPSKEALWRNSSYHWGGSSLKRKAYVLISFGFSLEMLLLHLHTLHAVVDGFMITESKDTYNRQSTKPLLLHDALANGNTIPQYIATKIMYREVDLHEAATTGHCSTRQVGWPRTFCVENWQRYQLLPMLFSVAHVRDVAILADVDEIARPSVVSMLTNCFPFGTRHYQQGHQDLKNPIIGKYIMTSTLYFFGFHCKLKDAWKNGPHAYAVAHLLAVYGTEHLLHSRPQEQGDSMSDRFSQSRLALGYSSPSIEDAGWHLSSFGSPSSIQQKYMSWGHANAFLSDEEQFYARKRVGAAEKTHVYDARKRLRGFKANGYEHDALNTSRLERCARECLNPYPQPMFNNHRISSSSEQTVPPCSKRNGSKIGMGDVPLGSRLRSPAPDLPVSLWDGASNYSYKAFFYYF